MTKEDGKGILGLSDGWANHVHIKHICTPIHLVGLFALGLGWVYERTCISSVQYAGYICRYAYIRHCTSVRLVAGYGTYT